MLINPDNLASKWTPASSTEITESTNPAWNCALQYQLLFLLLHQLNDPHCKAIRFISKSLLFMYRIRARIVLLWFHHLELENLCIKPLSLLFRFCTLETGHGDVEVLCIFMMVIMPANLLYNKIPSSDGHLDRLKAYIICNQFDPGAWRLRHERPVAAFAPPGFRIILLLCQRPMWTAEGDMNWEARHTRPTLALAGWRSWAQ